MNLRVHKKDGDVYVVRNIKNIEENNWRFSGRELELTGDNLELDSEDAKLDFDEVAYVEILLG